MRFMLMAAFGFLALLLFAPMWFAFMGVMGGALPWVAFGLLFIGVKSLAGPRRRYRHGWAGGPWEAAYRPARVPYSPSPSRPAASAGRDDRRLPLDVEMKVAQIKRKAEVLQKHAPEFPLGSEAGYFVKAISTDYLPRTLDAYLALPPRGRERVAVADGKTPLQELREQLSMLDGKLDEIAEDFERRNVDRLIANRRFLEERFKATGPTVDL
ncbi:MAG TPA: hypothetical protein VFS62_14355, partial [Chloroflexota bacterium]|jgi:hypothetical protein|nr:hypothetical protein [Chloroflexota bacterium]